MAKPRKKHRKAGLKNRHHAKRLARKRRLIRGKNKRVKRKHSS